MFPFNYKKCILEIKGFSMFFSVKNLGCFIVTFYIDGLLFCMAFHLHNCKEHSRLQYERKMK